MASALSAQGSIDVGVLTGGASYTVVITGGIMIFLVILAVMMPAGMDELFISTAILLPVGILLTLKATTDSPLFDASSWRKYFETHWPFGKKEQPK